MQDVTPAEPVQTISKIKEKFKNFNIKDGYISVFDIVNVTKSKFINDHSENSDEAGQLYDLAMGYATEIAKKFRQQRLHNDDPINHAGITGSHKTKSESPTYLRLFNENWSGFCQSGEINAHDSPVAYLTDLYKFSLKLDESNKNASKYKINERRSDLKNIKLNDTAFRLSAPALSIVNRVLREAIKKSEEEEQDTSIKDRQKKSGGATGDNEIYQKLSDSCYPLTLPYHHAYQRIELGLKQKKVSLSEVTQQMDAAYPYFINANTVSGDAVRALQQNCGLNPSLQAFLIDRSAHSLSQIYGSGADTNNLKNVSEFTIRTSVTASEVEEILCLKGVYDGKGCAATSKNYGALFIHKADAELTQAAADSIILTGNGASRTFSVADQGKPDSSEQISEETLVRLNQLIRLQHALKLPYDQLDWLIVSIMRAEKNNSLELTSNTLRALGVFRYFQNTYQVTPEVFSALVYQITQYAVGSDIPFLDRIFNHPPLFETPFAIDCAIEIDLDTKDAVQTTIVKQLCAGLGVDLVTFKKLVECVKTSQKNSICSLPIVSALYRMAKLPQLLGLTPLDGVALLERLGGENAIYQFAGTPTIAAWNEKSNNQADVLYWMMALAQAAQWLKAHQLSVQEISALLDAPPSDLSASPSHLAFINDIGRQLEKIRAADDKSACVRQARAVIDGLSRILKIEPPFVSLLLKWIGQDEVAFSHKTHALFKGLSEKNGDVSTLPDYVRNLYDLARHAAVVHRFKLSEMALKNFIDNPLWFGCLDNTLKLITLYRFGRYTDWIASTSQDEANIYGYLNYVKLFNSIEESDKLKTGAIKKLAELLTWTETDVRAATDKLPSTLADIDRVRRLQALVIQTSISVDGLAKAAQLTHHSSYSNYQAVGELVMSAIQQDADAKKQVASQHSETLRDALVAYYLRGGVAPDHVKTVDDLYEYLLIDTQVSSEVMTSEVAQAIASLQQYINSVMLHLEPGHDTPLEAYDIESWTKNENRYALWAANQQLQDYPENYIDPTLRLGKTTLFKELETEISQNKLNDDTVQQAVAKYLNKFEEVSNLKVISGYADGPDPTDCTYYFIGEKNISPKEYYWRSMDIRKRNSLNQVSPTAWSEWKKIDMPVSGNSKSDTSDSKSVPSEIMCVQPVVMGRRLYVVWVEYTPRQEIKVKESQAEGAEPQKVAKPAERSNKEKISVMLIYKKYDGRWSAPHTLLEKIGLNRESVHLAAFSGNSENKDYLYIEWNKNSHIILDCMLSKIITEAKENIPWILSSNLNRLNNIKYSSALNFSPTASLGLFQNTFSPKQSVFEVAENGDWQLKVVIQLPYFIFANARGKISVKNEELGLKNCELGQEDEFTCIARRVGKFTFELKLDGSGLRGQPEGIHYIYMDLNINIFEKIKDKNLGIDLKKPSIVCDEEKHVQYMDFGLENSSNGTEQVFPPARLTSSFGKQLIERASISIDTVLDRSTQELKVEPPIKGETRSQPLDFHGANGLYLWELFFHLPFLVAYRLNAEQQYAEAQRWLKRIFDPAGKNVNGTPDYWRVRPLVEDGHAGKLLEGPTDPDAVAYAEPVHYRKAVFLKYVQNLIDYGDYLYRQVSTDSLNEAKLYYYQARNLMGPRPDIHLANSWTPVTLEGIQCDQNKALRKFESGTDAQGITKEILDKMMLASGKPNPTLRALDTPFKLPLNSQLLDYWEKLDGRFYNLRHSLTIDGKPLSLPLYPAPMNPRELLVQRARSASGEAGALNVAQVIPPYRFRVLLPQAVAAVEMLIYFGNTLLSALERKERAAQEEQQQTQLLQLSDYALTTLKVQEQAIEIAQAGKAALEKSKEVASERAAHYSKLAQENISQGEQRAIDLHVEVASLHSAAGPLQTVGGGLNMMPNVFGFSVGGQRWGALVEAAAGAMQIAAIVKEAEVIRLDASEQYRRRQEEWKFQTDQAKAEVTAICAQIDTQNKQIDASKKALQYAQKEHAHMQKMYDFLSTRFTQASLYQWLADQLSTLYYQAYDTVLSLCLSVEKCWQYERGNFDTHFIRTDAWNSSYRGLLAGETLKLNLHQMESAYLLHNERRLEITKTVSLKKLLADDNDSKWRKKINEINGNGTPGQGTGKLTFELAQDLFDKDYPSHYLRQIKWISITLPTVLGPYQNVKAVLTQTGSWTLLKPDAESVKKLRKWEGGGQNIVVNLRANQQIALSSGLNDSGVFELNFGDERYLPFEGTGAVSRWELAFPNHTSDEQQQLLTRLDDIIVHVHYTALEGGADFSKKLADLEKEKPTTNKSSPNY